MSDPYVYVLMRADLGLGQQLVQACHAALEAGFTFDAPTRTANLVLCAVANQEELLEAAQHLLKHDIQVEVFFEPDNGIGYSALCTRPVHTVRERKALARYRLWRASAISAPSTS